MTELVDASLRHVGRLLGMTLLVGVLAAAGLFRLRTEVGYRAFLGEGHPAVVGLDRFVATFGGGLPLVAVWRCGASQGCEGALDPAALRMAYAVSERLRHAEGVRRVLSPATAPLLVPEFLDLPRARRLAPGGEPAADLEALQARALADPLWRGQLVSKDGRSGAIVVELAASDGETSRRVYAALDEALAAQAAAGFEFARIGGPVEFVVAGEELERETGRITPLMVLLIAFVIGVMFRSPVPPVLALAAMGLAVLFALGLAGWLGWHQNSLTQALPPLILVIGVCESVHLLSRYTAARLLDPEPTRAARERAMLQATRETGRACWYTVTTTAVAFAAFAPSDLQSIVRFGWLAAAGIMAAFLVTFTLLPVAVVRAPEWRGRPARGPRASEEVLVRGALLAARWRRPLLAITGLLALLGGLGLLRLSLDASFEDLYGKRSRVVEWASFAERHLRAADTLEISLEAPEGVDPLGAESLAVVERVSRDVEQIPGLGRSRSLLDALRSLGALVGSADGDWRERGASFVRLLDAEDPAVVEHYYAPEARALRVSVESGKLPQAELRTALDRVHALLARELPPGWRAEVTGPLAVVRELIDALRATQLSSFALSFVTVFALVWIFLRSLRLAALAMIPTLVPLVLTLGAMGALGIALDPGTTMVAAVVLGIAVDGAIHLLSSYAAPRAAGLSATEAVAVAVRQTGPALVATSLALAAGFALLLLSPWQSIANFGLVSSIAIFGALFANLALLPALLVDR